jgi:secretion/DNA translocation related CpaE-like protein
VHRRAPALLVSGNADVTSACRGVLAAAGVELEVYQTVPSGPAWDQAPLVLLGSGAGPVPSRRPGIVLVGVAPVAERIWREAVTCGAEHVAVLPDADAWLAQRVLEAVQAGQPAGRVIAVAGGCGGAGASVLTAALARTAAADGLRAVVVDADPLGGGIDLVLGAEDVPGLRWPDLWTARGRLQPGLLGRLLPSVDGVSVLSWERSLEMGGDVPSEAVRAVLSSARTEAEVVVVDLPRRIPEGTAAQDAAAGCDVALVVVPAHVRATAASVGVLDRLRSLTADVRLVVRRTRGGPAPVAVADALEAPLAAVIRPEPGLAAALDRGEPPALTPRGPLRRACSELLVDMLASAR